MHFIKISIISEGMNKLEIKILQGTLLHTNNYIIENETDAVLIEASCNLNDLKKKLGNKNLKAVLLTHGHWDHFLNVESILKEFNCPLYLTAEAHKKIIQKERAFKTDRKPEVNLDGVTITFISNEDVLNFGGDLCFRVIETPGHTNCSVCYVLEAEKETILFSGDTVFQDAIGRTDLPTASLKDIKNSIRKILELPNETIIVAGHGEITNLKLERESLEQIIQN